MHTISRQPDLQFLRPTQPNKESPDGPPKQENANDFRKQLAASLNKAEPQKEECIFILQEMQKNGIRELDLSQQQIDGKGIECLAAALEHQHSFLTDHLKTLNFSSAVLGTISPLLVLLQKVNGGSIESMNFSGLRIFTLNEGTGKKNRFPLHARHFTRISDIISQCRNLRSINMDYQHVLSALTKYSDGKPAPAPPMIELMKAVGESSIVDVSFKYCDLGPSDLLAIRDAVTTRESTGAPGGGLQFIRVDENPRMVDQKSYGDVHRFIFALDTNSSLQELYLPSETFHAFLEERLGVDLPSNRTLKKLEPLSTRMPMVIQPLEPLRARMNYNANPWPNESLEDQYKFDPDAAAAILKELTDEQKKEVERCMRTLPEGSQVPEHYFFFAKQVLRRGLDKQ